MKFFENGSTQVFALGGLGEVGKNMYVIMHNTELVIVRDYLIRPLKTKLGIFFVF